MEKYGSFLFLVVNIVNAVVVAVGAPTTDYCWRDFKGTLPSDALSAGVDEQNKPIYMGQVLANNKLIPGRIHEDDDNIYYEFGEQAWSSNENIKIFCTKHPNNFEWVSTSHYKVAQLSETLVRGGFEENFDTYIGRIIIKGKTNVGKVVCRKGTPNCLALYVNENGNYVEYKDFDILTYNPTHLM